MTRERVMVRAQYRCAPPVHKCARCQTGSVVCRFGCTPAVAPRLPIGRARRIRIICQRCTQTVGMQTMPVCFSVIHCIVTPMAKLQDHALQQTHQCASASRASARVLNSFARCAGAQPGYRSDVEGERNLKINRVSIVSAVPVVGIRLLNPRFTHPNDYEEIDGTRDWIGGVDKVT